MDNPDSGTRRLPARPFVGGRATAPVEARTFAYTPPRPFSFAGQRRSLKSSSTSMSTSTTSVSVAATQPSPTPLWTVAVYDPGMERAGFNDAPPRLFADATGDVADASLALADDVIEAQRHAASLAGAEVLEAVARRLRRGEILLLPGASIQNEAAVISSVLAAVLGGRR
jgi:hypothetical protein